MPLVNIVAEAFEIYFIWAGMPPKLLGRANRGGL
jgi:hypothetical protein